MAWKALTERRTEEAKKIRREYQKRGKDYTPHRMKQVEIIEDDIANCVIATRDITQCIINVSGQMKSTSMPAKFTGGTMEKKVLFNLKGKKGHEYHDVHRPNGIAPTVRENNGKITKLALNSTKATSPKSKQMTFPTMTSSPQDSPARRLVSQANAEDLTIHEALSFLKSHESVEQKSQDIYYLKTSRAYLVTSLDKLSRQSLKFSPTLGMFYNGKFSIVKTSESHRIGKECSLSDILEKNVDQKYFLSEKAVEGIFRNMKKGRGFAQIHSKQGTLKVEATYGQTSRIHKKEGISPTVPTASGGHHIPMICESED